MKILAVSTSTARGSVALLHGSLGLAVTASYVDLQGHAERLFQAIEQVLADAGETRAGVEALACDVGPGSFTGVRVGVASLKGIALGLGVPLAGAGSLEAMAAAAFGGGHAAADDVVLAAIDAKKDELFVAAYDRAGHELLAPRAAAASPEALAVAVAEAARATATGRVMLVGEILASLPLPHRATLVRDPTSDLPDAAWIARVAAPRLVGAPREVDAVYVRAPDVTLPRASG